MDLIDGVNKNGFMKFWLNQSQGTVNPRQKKWAGIAKTVNNGLLFQSKQKMVWV